MELASAIALINSVIYKPGWSFVASDYTNRFEGAVSIHVIYPAQQSEREQAAMGYPTTVAAKADFPMIVTDCDAETIYFRLLGIIREIEIHEAREFLRVSPTFWAPFHPHRVDGMRRWAERTGEDVNDDFRFGIT